MALPNGLRWLTDAVSCAILAQANAIAGLANAIAGLAITVAGLAITIAGLAITVAGLANAFASAAGPVGLDNCQRDGQYHAHMHDTPPIIRRYEPRDRAAVREICCDTADTGAPVEHFFPDRAVFADVLTRYYTDFAPATSWVAEQDGRVVGYLTGCLDTRQFLRTMAVRIVPAALLKALVHGSLWHRFIRQNWRRPASQRQQLLADYPAHLHLNLRAGHRGHGAGRQLLGKFLEQARHAGVTGIHAGVSETNVAGRKFFERAGFVVLGREARFRTAAGPTFTLLYGLRLVK